MQKYRIGRLTHAWENRTPPIRGGVFSDPDEDNSTDLGSDSDLSDASTLCASSSYSDDAALDQKATLRTAAKHEAATCPPEGIKSKRVTPPQRDAATEAFIQKTIQAEVDDNLRDYPSLDAQTQREIEARYHALHERVKNEGYYQCRYGEYAKELTRYLSIFALFMTTLLHGWYWTSACLLGLFWVSY